MFRLTRFEENPVLLPSIVNSWESSGTFNGDLVKINEGQFALIYRSLSEKKVHHEAYLHVSSIGFAKSNDLIHFTDHRQLIVPENDFEKFGCEDPRVTYIDGVYYIFYTALSGYPFSAGNIKVAVALTKDFSTIIAKHLVTPFNAKAMVLFPQKINGKYAAMLTVNTDNPPAKIALAYFDDISELYSEEYWKNWYAYVDDHAMSFLRDKKDQVEVGAVPIKTAKGWLFIYSYIKNYFSEHKVFSVEAALLDIDNPARIIARTKDPLLLPEESYERYGNIPYVVFPEGALVEKETLYVSYGAADTSNCIATCNVSDLLKEMLVPGGEEKPVNKKTEMLKRFDGNPILLPIPEHHWESKAVFNPAAVFAQGNIHLLYRALGDDSTSCLGYAVSEDGFHIKERLPYPVYIPREKFELKTRPGNSGCEDPRMTQIDDKFYMCYTAYDGTAPPAVALTSIPVKDFLVRKWTWEKPKIISPPGVDDKDACLLPRKLNGKYVFFHRIRNDIWIDYQDDLQFKDGKYLKGSILFETRKDAWDHKRIGIAAPPVETEKGWILFYHGYGNDNVYKVGVCLLGKENPSQVLTRTHDPIFESEMAYEKVGLTQNVVFPCGLVKANNLLYLYYGGADSVVGVATIGFKQIVDFFS